jgi:alkenylglycerophosphocholine hydrolase
MPTVQMVTKALVTTLMIIAAVAIHARPGSAKPFVVIGLVFCLIGDIALLDQVDRFIVGLGSFFIGHVFFAIAALRVGGHWRWAVVPVIVLVVVLGFAGRSILGGSGSLAPAVGAYFAVISVMAVLLTITLRPWAIVGAASFVVSDAILGWNKFVSEHDRGPLAVMVTYHVALAGLVLMLR